ncbi:uncharacterized protein LOC114880853 isoform X2 [Osmia bicornis bicornis]|uniref:uncharacterized protein LOC114880853 isoform X2 n=1 Tax=Osmia bicornis bicornis TaxID=1437191 RepID=UPI0010FA0ADF|nr:uncharacterized protein LOC114880853 isoform X2 [Osmia bicornis bicornis]
MSQYTIDYWRSNLFNYQKMKFYEFLALTTNFNELLKYLCTKNVIRAKVKCPRCNNVVELTGDQSLIIHCTQHYYKQVKGRKRRRVICNFKISALTGTWFAQSVINITVSCRLICYVMMMNCPQQRFLEKELNISSCTAVDWLMNKWLMCKQNPIGGNGIIVEIDEAFGRRKYHRGRLITGQWLFGGIQRGTKNMFVVPVVSRSAEVLLLLIEKYIAPGSIIYSDCWKAYKKIDKKIYQHSVVNHSENFVDPNTGIHTQNIERLWRDIRGGIPQYGRIEYHFHHYLAEFIFKKTYDFNERLDAFFEIMSTMYLLTENINE